MLHVIFESEAIGFDQASLLHPGPENAVRYKDNCDYQMVDVPHRPGNRYERHREINWMTAYLVEPLLGERSVDRDLPTIYGGPSKKSHLSSKPCVRHSDCEHNPRGTVHYRPYRKDWRGRPPFERADVSP